jgi:hypothetical protein
MTRWRPIAGAVLAAAILPAATAAAPPADLAELAQGTYHGDVVSDARGSSRSDVAITVTRSGPNTVSVSSDYPRLPLRSFKLTRAMSTIQNVGGTDVFLLDLSRSPYRLDLTIDDASWSGEMLPR